MTYHNHETELNYYSEIIDFFETSHSDPHEIEIWRSRQLIKLMDDLKHKRKTRDVVINSIIIINALLEEVSPADSFHHQDNSLKDLSIEEKLIFKTALEKELIIL